jgi:hypothetical protein
LPSETASDGDSISSGDRHSYSASHGVGIIGAMASDVATGQAMSIDSSRSVNNEIAGSPSVSHQDDYMDEHMDFEPYPDDDESQSAQSAGEGEGLTNFGDVEYKEEEEMEGFEFLTLEEQRQQLEDAIGAEMEQELYDARE